MRRILIVNNVFYPDEVAVSQYVSSCAFELATCGNHITVFAGRRDYENPSVKYSKHSIESGVVVERLWSTGFKKVSRLGRLFNFLTFQIALFLKMLFINAKQFDLVVGSTVPPLVPIVTSALCYIHRLPYVYWVMDLQPDEAVAAGYLRPGSLPERCLSRLAMVPLFLARTIVVLDRYMKERIVEKGVPTDKVSIVGLWPSVEADASAEDIAQFRATFGFGNGVVVMYSGNHSVCHPLDTLLLSAERLRSDERFVFAFIGSGVRKKDVEMFVVDHQLKNIVSAPYQPLKSVNTSLAAADIQCVVQGDRYSGLVHPSKMYGLLALGKPVLYIGPRKSYICDILDSVQAGIRVDHGDIDSCVNAIEWGAALSAKDRQEIRIRCMDFVRHNCNRSDQVGKLNLLFGGEWGKDA